MATFLQLCALLARRSGAIGTAPVSVVGQTGRQARCVDWVQEAWVDIQNLHRDWSFLYGTWESSTSIGLDTYTAGNLGIASRFGGWVGDREHSNWSGAYRPVTVYLPSRGVGDQGAITGIPFAAWEERYGRGSQTAGRPQHYAIGPDRTLRLGPVPDAVYTIGGEYRKAPQVLSLDADVPDLPEHHHNIIVDRAIILQREADGSPLLQGGVRAYDEKLHALRRECLPDITVGRSR